MRTIYLFSAFLILGMILSQLVNFASIAPVLAFLTDSCLAYIMMCVGLEFILKKERWKDYIWDYCIASVSAILAWGFCFSYFQFFFQGAWEENLLISRFAATASAGIVLSMLSAVGLAATWLFRKVQILAIFEDVDTILLLIPLQLLLIGMKWSLLAVVIFIVGLIIFSWFCLHRVKLPSNRYALFGYSLILTAVMEFAAHRYNVELEVLLPAFVWGSVLFNPHDPRKIFEHPHEHQFLEPEEKNLIHFDRGVKIAFLFLVGLSFPQIDFMTFPVLVTLGHILAITLLSNVGKCFPMFFYGNQASLKERIAVGISLFPRGAVGAGVLALALEYGIGGYVATVAGLSLALNLLLTGIFMAIVVRLAGRQDVAS